MGGNFIGLLFEHPTEELAPFEQNYVLIAIGLCVLGLVLGFGLFKFFKPKEKLARFERWLSASAERSQKFFLRMSSGLSNEHSWLTDKYSSPEVSEDAYVKKAVVGFVLVSVAWAIISFLRQGSGS